LQAPRAVEKRFFALLQPVERSEPSDLRTHKFEMRYLPGIVAWSGSAMRFDGDDLWIGLMQQPKGAAFSGGLLRYNLRTG
jgi:hypothetical protein